ncbi:MAG TPA: SpoIID/LytB domain-containing protein [Syntrophorhabdaceae bacterium]|nr:SpoIID/LytB domain-containing protein [Syntrophorhabdaceae bacterium]
MGTKSDPFLKKLASGQSACPLIKIGIMDNKHEVEMDLKGAFTLNNDTHASGIFYAKTQHGKISLYDKNKNIILSSNEIVFKNNGDSFFTLFHVKIGIDFHWEKREKQSFRGDLILKKRMDETIAVINEISLEDYLESVISSEMNSTAPIEFLKAHAIISRSWFISAIHKKNKSVKKTRPFSPQETENNTIIKWYEQEGHDIYDVCADDHCQRYQGITKITTDNPSKAVKETYGLVLTYKGEICDTRYSKACGGITEEYKTAWKDMDIPYLKSISDAEKAYKPIEDEEDARLWILWRPNAFCNVDDINILKTILPDFDLKTQGFFRWKVTYHRQELEDIIKKRSGHDLGTLIDIKPIKRGPSGRVFLLEITGTKKTITIGKELEIRRWLSHTHLLSSAFIVETKRNPSGEAESFTFFGAGWGHGVGLCQIGAGVMAIKGYTAQEILRHYFPDTKLEKVY